MIFKGVVVKRLLMSFLVFGVIFIGSLYIATAYLKWYLGKEMIWSAEAQLYNDRINAFNDSVAELNPHQFTDRIREKKKPKGIYRIAVLGDSFIYGDGLPYTQTWGHLLEDTLLTLYDSIEVMPWGQRGWSTLDEFNFLKEDGIKYEPDLVIFGFVDNDPDLGKIEKNKLGIVSWLRRQNYLPGIIIYAVHKLIGNSSERFMSQLYGSDNLNDYKQLWESIENYTDDHEISLLAVMTPSPRLTPDKQYFDAAADVFGQLDIPHLNLHGLKSTKLKGVAEHELMANIVNGHPGWRMNKLFSGEVTHYLKKEGYFKGLQLRN